jgi:REP element-mobilizing transposase RayT
MARPLRMEYEGAFSHITARGNERRKIYFGKVDYEKFTSYLRDAQDKFQGEGKERGRLVQELRYLSTLCTNVPQSFLCLILFPRFFDRRGTA